MIYKNLKLVEKILKKELFLNLKVVFGFRTIGLQTRTYPFYPSRQNRFFLLIHLNNLLFYTYSHNKYEPSIFDNGDFYGTPEEAFQTSAVYLDD